MDIAQLIVTIVGFIGLGVYQHYKIKTLKNQNKAMKEILENLKIYTDIIKPELLKFRIEQFEDIIEQKKDLEIKQMKEKFSKEMEKKTEQFGKSKNGLMKLIEDYMSSLTAALFFVPHNIRKDIIDKIKDDSIRNAFKTYLPIFKEYDEEKKKRYLKKFTDVFGNAAQLNDKDSIAKPRSGMKKP